jgi:hypothetical protein
MARRPRRLAARPRALRIGGDPRRSARQLVRSLATAVAARRGRRGADRGAPPLGLTRAFTRAIIDPPPRAKCCGCTEAFQASRAGSIPVARSARHIGEWRSLVAHPAGGRAVAGSNPVSPTREKVCFCRPFLLCEAIFGQPHQEAPRLRSRYRAPTWAAATFSASTESHCWIAPRRCSRTTFATTGASGCMSSRGCVRRWPASERAATPMKASSARCGRSSRSALSRISSNAARAARSTLRARRCSAR